MELILHYYRGHISVVGTVVLWSSGSSVHSITGCSNPGLDPKKLNCQAPDIRVCVRAGDIVSV